MIIDQMLVPYDEDKWAIKLLQDVRELVQKVGNEFL